MINKQLNKSIDQDQKIQHLLQHTKQLKGNIQIGGAIESSTSFLTSYLIGKTDRQGLIIASNENRAKQIYDEIKYISDKPVVYFPGQKPVFFKFDAKSQVVLSQKIESIIELIKNQSCIVVTTVEGSLNKMAPKSVFCKNVCTIKTGDIVEIEDIVKVLHELGYERAAQIEGKGQYAIRGGIIDVFMMNNEKPFRIELFDNEVDSIRQFEIMTQRSIENSQEITIYPAHFVIPNKEEIEHGIAKIKQIYEKQIKRVEPEKEEKLKSTLGKIIDDITQKKNTQLLENYIEYFYDHSETIMDYMTKDTMIYVDEYERIGEKLSQYEKELSDDFKGLLEKGECVPEEYDLIYKEHAFYNQLNNKLVIYYVPFLKKLKGIDTYIHTDTILMKQHISFQGKLTNFVKEVEQCIKKDYKVIIITSTEEREHNIKDYLVRHNLQAIEIEHEIAPSEGVILLEKGSLGKGFEMPSAKVVVFSDGDIFSTAKAKRKRIKDPNAKPIKLFTDLKPGDYVVHENHGVGRFEGIVQLDVQETKKDYLKIHYSGEDVLYVNIEQMEYVQKFMGADAKIPKINKLNSPEWKKTKTRVKKEIQDMAEELLVINAKRNAIEGYSFSKDSVWQQEFEEKFPYEETNDQLRCIEEIKGDMEILRPMDRLLCGDVGYGKTEVAIRAAFKSIVDGKQVAVLVPTTILANQHYATFTERMKDYPFNVEMVSRFRTDKEIEAIEEKIESGQIDVIVGTHRLLSKDVKFKDLGLLIIDEEQKFGVKHKEIIKQIKSNVDVLTLSATPIPRTLNMSLMGIRDMSVIEEPPEERFPVQTYVLENDEEVVREAIMRELDRDGQVFLLFNRVRGIRRVSAEIQKLVPEARVAVAHGQMNENDLEKIMLSFMEGKYDVLVATTIIESGIDIPNANTMIIYDSDRFGLSQLYQLRGRVGRSDRMAYAYFMYQKDKILTEQAEKRLKAIKEFTEFGAGFKISMRDLEIRGAGNLLGSQQHGHMMLIGYELYCKLLDETVKKLQGETVHEEKEVKLEITLSAYIPNNYISDENTKIEVYKSIAAVNNPETKLDIEDELIDRFGDIPKVVSNLINIAYMTKLCKQIDISKVSLTKNIWVIEFYEKNQLNPIVMTKLVEKYKQQILINANKKPVIKYTCKGKIEELIEFLETQNQIYLN